MLWECPYSFATAAVGAGKKSAFVSPLLQKEVHGLLFEKKCIVCFLANLPVLHQFRCNTLAGPIVYNTMLYTSSANCV